MHPGRGSWCGPSCPALLIEFHPNLSGDPPATHGADIGVQLRRFKHHDLVARSVGALGFSLYGSAAYLARLGGPDVESGCFGHQLSTLLSDREFSAQAAWLDEHDGRAQVVLQADSYETQHWAVACGSATL